MIPVKIYFVSSIENRMFMTSFEEKVIKELKDRGIGVIPTSDWYYKKKYKSISDFVKADISNIDNSDILVAVHPYGFGTVSEMAYAYAKKIPVFYLRSEETKEDDPFISHTLWDFNPVSFSLSEAFSASPAGLRLSSFSDLIKAIFFWATT